MAILPDGRIASWGDNTHGQLGFGKTLLTSTPLEISFPTVIESVSVAETHVLALDTEGNVWSWGSNHYGELGDNSKSHRANPRIVFQGATQIAASRTVSLAIDASGKIWEWGNEILSPTAVEEISTASAIFSGGATKIALDDEGKVWAWGDGENGKLANNETYSSVPQQIEGLPPIQDIGIGKSHLLAVDGSGEVWAWGSAVHITGTTLSGNLIQPPTKLTGLPAMRQVGVGGPGNYGIGNDGAIYGWLTDPSSFIKPPQDSISFVSLSVGDYHGLAIDHTGTPWGWGANNVGQIGTNESNISYKQITLSDTSAKFIAASDYGETNKGSSFFVTTDGKVFALGSNHNFQLAIPIESEVTASSTPSIIPNLTDATDVSARRGTSYVITGNGSLYGWGKNESCEVGLSVTGQCSATSIPSKVEIPANIEKVAYGGVATLALDDQGRVWSWGQVDSELGRIGDNTIPGRVNVLPTTRGIARGLYHSAVLTDAGTVWTWGRNSFGQLGLGFFDPDDPDFSAGPTRITGLERITQVASGENFTAVLDQDGVVRAWGENSGGPFGFETTVNEQGVTEVEPAPITVPLPTAASAIFVENTSLCALLINGSARCYGWNFSEHAGKTFSFSSPIEEIAIGGSSGKTVHFQLADGTVRAYGKGSRGQLGTGVFTSADQPQVVLNEAGDNFLDLDPTTPNAILADELPPFLTKAVIQGTLSSLSLDVDLRGRLDNTFPSRTRSDEGIYNVYVALVAPEGEILAWSQLDSESVWSSLTWPMLEYLEGVDLDTNDDFLVIQILNSADASQLPGASIYLGYGLDPDEMVATERYRIILSIEE